MALRNIVTTGDPILEKVCRPVEKFDKRLGELIDDMKETLIKANGAGIAAPQVGVLRRVCLVDSGEKVYELVNPEIIEASGSQDDIEGCLSFPGKWGMVERPMRVKVKAQDRKGKWYEAEGEGLTARAFCHEIDHLNGVVFITKVSRMIDPEELVSGGENEDE